MWEMPTVPYEKIYQIGIFDFQQMFHVKTVEQSISVDKDYCRIKLLNSKMLKKYQEKKFKYAHYGCVQVCIKPLTRKGLDRPILVILRDATMCKFNESQIAMLQSNTCNNPVFFTCYPDFIVDLSDPTILNTLVLDIHTQKTCAQARRKEFVIIYRLIFKVLNTDNTGACMTSEPGQTVLLEANPNNEVLTPRLLKWNEIDMSEQWEINEDLPPPEIQPNTDVSQIIEHPDGSTTVRFNSGKQIKMGVARSSSSRSMSSTFSRPFEPARSSSSVFEEATSKLKGVDFSSTIPKPIYRQSSPTLSPTRSDMQFDQLNVISIEEVIDETFEIDKDFLRQNFALESNKLLKKWYFSTFPKEKTIVIRELWYTDMKKLRANILFFY
ncbi:hypothetical protein Dimus_037812 [Dionaea muscipula]